MYEDLLGPYPFSSLRVVAIDDEAGVGIGASRRHCCPPAFGGRCQRPLQSGGCPVATHELGHQYFFNLIGIVDAGEGWMSEGFAEYLALRASEAREGSSQHEQRNYWAYLNRVPADGDVPIQGTAVRTSTFAYEILYLKASAFLSLLERHIGRERFDGLLGIRPLFAYSNTTTEEFLGFLQSRDPTGELERLFDAWAILQATPPYAFEPYEAARIPHLQPRSKR